MMDFAYQKVLFLVYIIQRQTSFIPFGVSMLFKASEFNGAINIIIPHVPVHWVPDIVINAGE